MNSSGGFQSMKAMKPGNGPSSGSKLNPFAREWDPVRDRAPEEDRSLFLTFAEGFPLSETEIFQFFTSMFGPCIERVYHPPYGDGNRQKYAKVIFRYSYIPVYLMANQNEAKFIVNAKPMWCKRFRPMMIQN